ncbi:GspE/PulE family protein [Planctomycetota bacterium]
MKLTNEGNSAASTVKRQTVSDEDAARSLAKKHGFEFVKLTELELSPHIVRVLPESLVVQHKVIAVKLEADTLYVAMVDPWNLSALDEINLVTGFNVKQVVATKHEITQVINKHYGVEQTTKQELVDAKFHQEDIGQSSEAIDDLALTGEAGQVIRLINSIIKDAIDSCASDIHLEPRDEGMYVRFRIDGILQNIMTIPVSVMKEVISRVKILAKMDITERRRAQDGHIDLKYKSNDYDMRVSVTPTINGEKTVIRVLNRHTALTNLTQLGLAKEDIELLKSVVNIPHGMVLVTGPTGSGKTTTLYALLQSINAIEKNIITIENPVEYKLDRINQIQIDPAINETFASVLRNILRQDPDVIMVGEVRDQETAEIAVQAAQTGHLVLTTMHTNNAATAVTRLRDLGIPPFLISSCVATAIAQRLVRKICLECRIEYQPTKEELKSISVEDASGWTVYRNDGCGYCFGTGYRGRIGVYEIININEDIRETIMHERSSSELEKMAIEKGAMRNTLIQAALRNVREGITTINEVKRVIVWE